jgi:hypothetical protein
VISHKRAGYFFPGFSWAFGDETRKRENMAPSAQNLKGIDLIIWAIGETLQVA